jgi:hypothetical protein
MAGGGGDAAPQPGDTGIWVTCARHQEGKAAREIGVLFAEVCVMPFSARLTLSAEWDGFYFAGLPG